jgi:hypothetical protein
MLAGRHVYTIQRVDEEPDQFSSGIVYVIEDAGQAWAAAMACPGGCGQVLHMNLLLDTKPVWRLTLDASGSATLSPSIWRREGCGCHFWLRGGRVEWCDRERILWKGLRWIKFQLDQIGARN